MITLQHPLAPTITYDCSLPKALTSYAMDFLFAYDVFVVSDTCKEGVTLEVIDKGGKDLGLVMVLAA